jgi:malate dehydrogenase
VTGAAGQIAYSLLPLLASGQVFGHDQPIQLQLLDIEPCLKVLGGVVMELEDCEYPLLTKVLSGADPREMLREADVAIFLGGFPRKPGMERKDLLKTNAKIFIDQGKALNEVAKKTCHSLVVANPANTNCLILSQNAPSLPKENFSALTRLDQNRGVQNMAQKLACSTQDITQFIIWGNHSNTQFADYTHTYVKGECSFEVIDRQGLAHQWFQEDLVSMTQGRGAEVLQARGLSSGFSTAFAIKDHIRDLYQGNERTYVSAAVLVDSVHADLPFEGTLCCSVPVKCLGAFKYEVLSHGLKMDHNEKVIPGIQRSINELVEERNLAFE